jgi:glycosyltransferase involved in cell wall biosynthesis
LKRKTKVSIILTSYNHAKYLRQSIESVLNQSFSDFELIIWDDASTDNSWEIINSYSDPRIRSFQSKENVGGTIQLALQIALAGYIAIHHSDDLWAPTKLEKQVDYLENHPNVGAVFTNVQVIDEDGDPYENKDHPYYAVFDQPNRSRFEWLNHFFYNGNALCHPSILIRKICYNNIDFREGITQLPDFDKWIQLCLKYDIHILQEKLTLFRVRDDEANVSGNRPDNRIRSQFELLKVLDHYKSISSADVLLKIFPEASQYIHDVYTDILFALGMIAVESQTNNVIKLFGLNLLFDAINTPERAEQLMKFLNFDKETFKELTAKHDVFSSEDLSRLQNQILKLTTELVNREQEIRFFSTSKSWRLTSPFRKLAKLIRKPVKVNDAE